MRFSGRDWRNSLRELPTNRFSTSMQIEHQVRREAQRQVNHKIVLDRMCSAPCLLKSDYRGGGSVLRISFIHTLVMRNVVILVDLLPNCSSRGSR